MRHFFNSLLGVAYRHETPSLVFDYIIMVCNEDSVWEDSGEGIKERAGRRSWNEVHTCMQQLNEWLDGRV